MLRSILLCLAFGTPLSLLAQAPPTIDARSTDAVVAFTNVNLLPMTDGSRVVPDQTVVVRAGIIQAVGPAGQVEVPPGAIRIDASGQYLMPGLAEMQAHIPVPEDGDDSKVRETLFLYLSNGITTIRGMLGDPYHLELREAVAATADEVGIDFAGHVPVALGVPRAAIDARLARIADQYAE